MEKYEIPEMQICFFSNEDIIATSGFRNPEDDELPEVPIGV